MKKTSLLIFVTLVAALTLSAAEKTWTGSISDSMCGASHKDMEHGAKKMTARECVQMCVKGGSRYVFASGSKVYGVENQSFAGLETHAGHTVKLTGEMSADGKTIKVSKIEMPGKKKGKKA
jgi:uncharacterized protein YdeI (BOF family)